MKNKPQEIIERYIGGLDLCNLSIGRHELGNGDYVNITEYETAAPPCGTTEVLIFSAQR